MRIVFDLERTGSNIMAYREQMRMTVKELAISTCRPVEQIEGIEDGIKYPSLHAIEEIANALNVHPIQIMAFVVEGE